MSENHNVREPEKIDISWPPAGDTFEEFFTLNFKEIASDEPLEPSRKIVTSGRWWLLRPIVGKMKEIFFGEIVEALRDPFNRLGNFTRKTLSLIELLRFRQNSLDEKIDRSELGRVNLQKHVESENESIKGTLDRWGRRLDSLENFSREYQTLFSGLEKEISGNFSRLETDFTKNYHLLVADLGGLKKDLAEMSRNFLQNWPRVEKFETELKNISEEFRRSNRNLAGAVELLKMDGEHDRRQMKYLAEDFSNSLEKINRSSRELAGDLDRRLEKIDGSLADSRNRMSEIELDQTRSDDRLIRLEESRQRLAEEFNTRVGSLEDRWSENRVRMETLGLKLAQSAERLNRLADSQRQQTQNSESVFSETRIIIEELRTRLMFYGENLQVLEDRRRKLLEEVASRITRLENSDAAGRDNSEELRKQILAAHNQLDEYINQAAAGNTVLAGSIAELEKFRKDGQARMEEIIESLDHSNQRLDVTEKFIKGTGPRLDELEEGKRFITGKMVELNSELEKQIVQLRESGLNSLNQRLIKIENETPKIEKMSRDISETNDRLNVTRDNLETKINESGREIIEKISSEENILKQRGSGLDQRLNDLEWLFNERRPKLEQLDRMFNESGQRFDEIGRRIEGTDGRLSTINSDLSGQINQLTNVWQTNWSWVGELEKTLNQTNLRVDEFEQISREIIEKQRVLDGQGSELSNQMARLAEKMKRLMADRKSPEFLSDLDYLDYENKFRGSSEEIREKQARYLDYFENCQQVLDIGCGRGEFLELLRDRGIGGRGVDNNQAMIELCRSKSLEVVFGKVPEFLKKLKIESLDGIFISQVVEHLTPGQLAELIMGLFSKMKPGARLVIETVNPMSFVALAYFYQDPSHRQPVLPGILEFLAQKAGFNKEHFELLSPVPAGDRLKNIFLGDAAGENFGLIDEVIFGHRDYLIVFRK